MTNSRGSIRKGKQLDEYATWLLTPLEERVIKTRAEMARRLKVTEATLCNWEKLLNRKETTDEDNITIFKERLYKEATKVGASARHMELYARYVGLNLEKQEPAGKVVEFNADDIARQSNEADRRVRELERRLGVYGEDGLQEESSVLHGEVLQD